MSPRSSTALALCGLLLLASTVAGADVRPDVIVADFDGDDYGPWTTTGTAFGSLWLSAHPGTASMGLLLMISLGWTLVTTLLFEPALLGPPPERPLKG